MGSSVSMPAADLAMQRKVPTRLIWMIQLNASSGKCLMLPSSLLRLAVLIALPVPAQLTRMRSCPCASRSEEHTSELQSLMRISYAVFCLKKKTRVQTKHFHDTTQLASE